MTSVQSTNFREQSISSTAVIYPGEDLAFLVGLDRVGPVDARPRNV